MNDKLTIRRAEPKDAEIIAGFNRATARETEDMELKKDTALRGVKAILEDPTKGFYLVAEIDGRVVGQLMVTDEWSDWRGKYFWWIQSVYVDKEFRQQKIFSRLYYHLLDMVKLKDDVAGIRLYVEKDNRVAQKVYEALGMSKTVYKMYEIEID